MPQAMSTGAQRRWTEQNSHMRGYTHWCVAQRTTLNERYDDRKLDE